MIGSQDEFEKLIFREGLCTECGEQKQLAMVNMGNLEEDGSTFAYVRRDPLTGKPYLMAPPRVGFCEPCALRLAKEGRFGGKKKRNAQPR